MYRPPPYFSIGTGSSALLSPAPPYIGILFDEDVNWIIRNGVQEQVRAGEVIIEEGEPLDALFVILEGSFTVVMTHQDFEPPPLGPGEIAGEMSYIRNHLPLATVTAEEDSVVLRIPRERLDEKRGQDPGFARRFRRMVNKFRAERMPANPSPLGEQRPIEVTESERMSELISWMLNETSPKRYPWSDL